MRGSEPMKPLIALPAEAPSETFETRVLRELAALSERIALLEAVRVSQDASVFGSFPGSLLPDTKIVYPSRSIELLPQKDQWFSIKAECAMPGLFFAVMADSEEEARRLFLMDRPDYVITSINAVTREELTPLKCDMTVVEYVGADFSTDDVMRRYTNLEFDYADAIHGMYGTKGK